MLVEPHVSWFPEELPRPIAFTTQKESQRMPHPTSHEGRPHLEAIPKVPTGIGGLDEVLHGGLAEGRTTLISGGPGTGKTLLSLEILYRGVLAGQPGLFVTFEETADAIRRDARALGWDLDALERSGMLFILQADVSPDMILSGDFSVGGLLAILAGKLNELGARCVVLDAVDVLMRVFRDPAREQSQFLIVRDWLRQRSLNSLLTVKTTDGGTVQYPFLDFMADCVIRLDQRVDGQVTTRRLRVLKFRGSGYMANECPFLIDTNGTGGGFVVMPVPSLVPVQHPLDERLSTGNRALDELTGGGYWRGSCVLVIGSSGTGKTTLACTFAVAACRRGEKVLYVSFEDSDVALVKSMGSPGIDLSTHREAGRLLLHAVMPESLGVEQHLHQILQARKAFSADHVVVDSISACRRLGSQHAAFDFLVRLLTHSKTDGVTCLFVNQRSNGTGHQDASGIGIASLVDTLVELGLVACGGTLERTLLVRKSRGTKHSLLEHRFLITEQGLELPVSAAREQLRPPPVGTAPPGSRS